MGPANHRTTMIGRAMRTPMACFPDGMFHSAERLAADFMRFFLQVQRPDVPRGHDGAFTAWGGLPGW
jgi:hypothetical protein